ncbi:GntR family transcriptional regulator [Hyphococcus formosus]|uniref:GntR family transcriptional regulator n=1 Tax=Hyphococcus formosus TaxID=3143534 RepID=UPI00398ACA21
MSETIVKKAEPQESERKSNGVDATATGSGNKRGGVPAYYQLYVLLAQQIRDGEYAAEEVLPSENEMTAQYGVSRITVRNALQQLEQDGLVRRRRGARTVVLDRGPKDNPPLFEGPVENLLTRGVASKVNNLEMGWTTPPKDVSESLRLKLGTECFHLSRLRYHGEQPFSITRLFAAPFAMKDLDTNNISDEPLLYQIERTGFLAVAADQLLSAVLAQGDTAKKLNIPIGSALIQLRRTVYGRDNVPFMYHVSLYRPDQYEYNMRLSRETNSTRPQWRHV